MGFLFYLAEGITIFIYQQKGFQFELEKQIITNIMFTKSASSCMGS